jgi:signal transduction histidine kinase
VDISIGLSYLAISTSLVYLVYRARDAIPYHHVFLAFGGFILSCGLGHFGHVWTQFNPNSHVEGYLGVVTALTSITTAAVLPPLIPKVLYLINSAQVSEQRKAMLQQQNEFFTVVAHELKTPLTAMLGYDELLKRRIAKDGNVSNSIAGPVTVMGDQTRRLARLIDSLLDLSRMQQGKYAVQPRPIDLSRFVTEVVDRFHVTVTDAHVLDMRSASEPLWVSGDDLALEQVLQNLLQNAVKYSPDGGQIKVAVESTDAEIYIRVTDQGIGIPAQDQAFLCQQFYRAGNVDSLKMSGFGVGLYVANQILHHHNGRLQVESVEGVGSTFTVVLPRLTDIGTHTSPTTMDEPVSG